LVALVFATVTTNSAGWGKAGRNDLILPSVTYYIEGFSSRKVGSVAGTQIKLNENVLQFIKDSFAARVIHLRDLDYRHDNREFPRLPSFNTAALRRRTQAGVMPVSCQCHANCDQQRRMTMKTEKRK